MLLAAPIRRGQLHDYWDVVATGLHGVATGGSCEL